MRCRAVAAALAVATAPPLAAQAEPGSTLVVQLLTVGVGEVVYERFGHNAIVITDTATGQSLSYNYGLFSFAQEHFVLRFAQGRMWYAMGSRATRRDLDLYVRRDRDIWLTELRLTPAQRLALRDFLFANDTDERRNYRYDYYRDNCSTRVRDALDLALGGAIRRAVEGRTAGLSFRDETRRLMAPDVVMGTLIDLAEGHPVDTAMSAWDAMFVPMRFRGYLREVTVPGPDGRPVPLVAGERQVYRSSRFTEAEAPPDRRRAFALAGLAAAAILVGLAEAGRRRRAGRIAFGAAGALWALVAGLGGLVLLGLWLLTDHVVTRANENVLLLSPLALPLVVLIPMLAAGTVTGRRWAPRVAVLLALLAFAGAALKVVPAFDQPNHAILLLLLPAHLGLALGTWRLATVER